MHQHAPIHWKENVKRYLKITERNKKKKNHDQEDTDSVHTHARMGGAGGRGAGGVKDGYTVRAITYGFHVIYRARQTCQGLVLYTSCVLG